MMYNKQCIYLYLINTSSIKCTSTRLPFKPFLCTCYITSYCLCYTVTTVGVTIIPVIINNSIVVLSDDVMHATALNARAYTIIEGYYSTHTMNC
jgi:hypothetical protein